MSDRRDRPQHFVIRTTSSTHGVAQCGVPVLLEENAKRERKCGNYYVRDGMTK